MTQSFGRYEIQHEIGRGAMGIVYRARDPQLDRVVALKALTLPPGAPPSEQREMQERFDREARTAGRLVHPSIVRIYDSGPSFIAMELLEGRTLDRWMEAGGLPIPWAIRVLEQVAAALDFAHERGVIHRDVKPGNVVVTDGGEAKIMDFGIAKVLGASVSTARLMGTPRYMSPEQVSGAEVGAPSDNFALAEIAYELLTSQQAFPGETVANILYRIVHEDPPPPSFLNRALSRAVDPVFARAMAKTPAHRYESASEFVRDLREALERKDLVHQETQAGEVLATRPRAWLGPVLRVVLIPPAVVLAGLATLVAVLPEARLLAREYLGIAPHAPAEPVRAPVPEVTPEAPRTPPATMEATAVAPSSPAPGPMPSPTATPSPPPTPPPTAPVVRPPSTPAPKPAAVPLGPGSLHGLQFFPSAIPGVPGAVVRSVVPGSAAAGAGLRPKDIITSWQGTLVGSPRDLEGQDRSPSRSFAVAYMREEGGALQERFTTLTVGGAAAAPRVSLGGVRLEHGAREGGTQGMFVHADVEASGYRDRTLTVRLRFQEITEAGTLPVTTAEGAPVERSATVEPASDAWVSGQVTLFVPYTLLPSGAGEHAMRLIASVVDESGRELAAYAPYPFLLSGGAP